jgi:antitoxin VapB
MKTAKVFQHGGSQAVRLPKEFRFDVPEVTIQRRGDAVVLRAAARPVFTTLAALARHLAERYPRASGFPDIERPRRQQARDLDW